jgi:hypothetical protein
LRQKALLGDYNYRKRSLRRNHGELRSIGFGPVGRSGFVRGPGGRVYGVPTHDERWDPVHDKASGGNKY